MKKILSAFIFSTLFYGGIFCGVIFSPKFQNIVIQNPLFWLTIMSTGIFISFGLGMLLGIELKEYKKTEDG